MACSCSSVGRLFRSVRAARCGSGFEQSLEQSNGGGKGGMLRRIEPAGDGTHQPVFARRARRLVHSWQAGVSDSSVWRPSC